MKKLTDEEREAIKAKVNEEETSKVVTTSSKEKYEIVEVPVQTSLMIREIGTDNILDDKAILLTILNKLNAIEKAVA